MMNINQWSKLTNFFVEIKCFIGGCFIMALLANNAFCWKPGIIHDTHANMKGTKCNKNGGKTSESFRFLPLDAP